MKLSCGNTHLTGPSPLGKPTGQRGWGLPKAQLSTPESPSTSQYWTSQDSWLEERAVHFWRWGTWGRGILGIVVWTTPWKGKRRHSCSWLVSWMCPQARYGILIRSLRFRWSFSSTLQTSCEITLKLTIHRGASLNPNRNGSNDCSLQKEGVSKGEERKGAPVPWVPHVPFNLWAALGVATAVIPLARQGILERGRTRRAQLT